jgi:N-acetylneuraminic acid mutarotase
MTYQRDNTDNAVLNGQVYVLGGAPAGTSVLSYVEKYDPPTDTWVTETNMQIPRYGLMAASVNGVIYAIGGASAVDGTGPITQNEVYDPAANTWSYNVPTNSLTTQAGTAGKPILPLPTGRWGGHAAVIDGLIYTVGGAIRDSSGNETFYGTVEVYDPVYNTWTTKTPMPAVTTPQGPVMDGREGMAVAVVNGLIYAIGGWGGWPELAYIQVYDPSSDTWSTSVPSSLGTIIQGTMSQPLPDMPTPRDDFAFGVVNGVIYAIAGDTGTFSNANLTSCCTNVVEAYNPVTNTWNTATNAITIRDDFEASVVDSKIYALAGSRDGIFTNPLATPAFLAANQGGYSLTTNEVGVLSSISVPTALQASPGSNQVNLSWNPVSGANSYNIYWSHKAGVSTSFNSTQIANIATTSKSITGLTTGIWYYYVVTAVTTAGESLPSSEVAVKM